MPHIEAPGFVARYRFTIPVVLILIGVQIAWYTLLWTSLIRQPDLGGVDFIIFYTAGVLSNQGQLHDLYNVARQHAIQAPIVGEQFIQGGVLPFNHPPFLAPVLGLVVTENYTYSYVAWCVVQLALLALMCTTAVIWLRERGWTRGQAIMGGVALSMFYPLFISFLKGQDTIIIVLAAVIWARALSREDDRTAGLALALTVIKPQIALMLALPTLAVRWRAFAWFVGGAGVLAIVSVLLVGQRGVEDYLTILRITSRGEGFGINQSAMQNMLALMLQIVPGLGLQLAQSIAWLLYIGAVIGISAIWRKRG